MIATLLMWAGVLEAVSLAYYAVLAWVGYGARQRHFAGLRGDYLAHKISFQDAWALFNQRTKSVGKTVAYLRTSYPFLMFVVVLVVYFTLVYFNPGTLPASPPMWTIFAATAVLTLPGTLLLRWRLDVRGALEIDGPALTLWQQVTIPRATLVRSALWRYAFIYIIIVFLVEGLGFSYAPAQPLLLIGVALLYFVFIFGVVRWLVPRSWIGAYVLPLAQTPWADLAPRIQTWSQRIGVQVRETLVTYSGGEDISVAGPGVTLVLNAQVLAAMETRQLDTLFARQLWLAHERYFAQQQRAQAIQLVLSTSIVTVVLGLALTPFTTQLPPWISHQAAPYGLPMLLVVLIGSRISRRSSAQNTAINQAADTFSAQATGDPIALMVALNSLRVLGATKSGRYVQIAFERVHPALQQRIFALDALARRPDFVLTPAARQPVPAITPLQLGPYVLTTPLAAPILVPVKVGNTGSA